MLICFILLACSKTKREDRSIKTIPSLYGKWQMIDWNGVGKPELDIYIDFKIMVHTPILGQKMSCGIIDILNLIL